CGDDKKGSRGGGGGRVCIDPRDPYCDPGVRPPYGPGSYNAYVYSGSMRISGNKADEFLYTYAGATACNDDDWWFQYPDPCEVATQYPFTVQVEIDIDTNAARLYFQNSYTTFAINAWFEPYNNDSGLMF